MTALATEVANRAQAEAGASAWQMPTWRKLAACQSADPDTLFPDNGRPPKSQLDPCLSGEGCPVRAQCLEFALEGPWMPFGPWGGHPQAEVQTMWLSRHPRDRSDDESVLAYIGVFRGGSDED